MDPTGWSLSRDPASASRAGCRQAGTETASPCLALALSCPVGGRARGELGRVAPCCFTGAMLIYTSAGCNADRHGSGGRMGLGGSQRGSMREGQKGGPALSPTLGASSRRVSAARLLPGSRQDLPGAPNLAHFPPLFALILPSSAPGRGRWHIRVVTRDIRLSLGLSALSRSSLRASAWLGALPSHPCLRGSLRCAVAQGHPIPRLGTIHSLQDAGHQGGSRTVPALAGGSRCDLQDPAQPLESHTLETSSSGPSSSRAINCQQKVIGSTWAKAPTAHPPPAPAGVPMQTPHQCRQSPATSAQPILGASRLLLRR